jgi:hypothetical protein
MMVQIEQYERETKIVSLFLIINHYDGQNQNITIYLPNIQVKGLARLRFFFI